MAEIREYILVDEKGETACGPTRDIKAVRRQARTGAARQAIVAQIYELTHEECVEFPEGAEEWPPAAADQDASGRRWIKE